MKNRTYRQGSRIACYHWSGRYYEKSRWNMAPLFYQ